MTSLSRRAGVAWLALVIFTGAASAALLDVALSDGAGGASESASERSAGERSSTSSVGRATPSGRAGETAAGTNRTALESPALPPPLPTTSDGGGAGPVAGSDRASDGSAPASAPAAPVAGPLTLGELRLLLAASPWPARYHDELVEIIVCEAQARDLPGYVDPTLEGDRHRALGLTQIRADVWPRIARAFDLLDPRDNLRAAWVVFLEVGRKFAPTWSCAG